MCKRHSKIHEHLQNNQTTFETKCLSLADKIFHENTTNDHQMKNEAAGFVRGTMHTLKWRRMKTESDWLKSQPLDLFVLLILKSVFASLLYWTIHIKTGSGLLLVPDGFISLDQLQCSMMDS